MSIPPNSTSHPPPDKAPLLTSQLLISDLPAECGNSVTSVLREFDSVPRAHELYVDRQPDLEFARMRILPRHKVGNT